MGMLCCAPRSCGSELAFSDHAVGDGFARAAERGGAQSRHVQHLPDRARAAARVAAVEEEDLTARARALVGVRADVGCTEPSVVRAIARAHR